MSAPDKKRLLWVDDDPAPIDAIIEAVRQHFDVRVVRTLGDAVAAVKNAYRARLSGYIVDLDLPMRNAPSELNIESMGTSPLNSGQAFVRWLRRVDPNAKVLYLTQQPGYFDSAIAGGEAAVVGKRDEAARRHNIIETIRKELNL